MHFNVKSMLIGFPSLDKEGIERWLTFFDRSINHPQTPTIYKEGEAEYKKIYCITSAQGERQIKTNNFAKCFHCSRMKN